MQLTKNFTLDEMLRSQTATRLNIQEQFNPPLAIINNLKSLCENVYCVHRALFLQRYF